MFELKPPLKGFISVGVVDEGSIKGKERSISNAEDEFEILDGVCGEIVLQFVTPDGEIYTRKYDRKHHIPKVIKLN
ncbi:hypothetical protein BAQ45_08780 [Bacillus pacificus]|uniref:Uncharacterized protein n=1 Tax=Bacillus cereus (strain ATCC 10987 / NRS 248) TaxID=222523 RepID=Q737P7_BACC1|nr:hypothetical protein BCE_2600 [Bacillus cereus ATCC 10987]KXY81695.1 hypothetical protein AT272_02675 [Bacillus cereus]OBZ54748.1 hypothetical protein UN66_25580 [Bacillus cereus]OJE25946.1 hypothetical protein BAQ45_08780 [Bacillus pacificus]